jgi:hypothetical protein
MSYGAGLRTISPRDWPERPPLFLSLTPTILGTLSEPYPGRPRIGSRAQLRTPGSRPPPLARGSLEQPLGKRDNIGIDE